jgi:hypothetical protein
LRVAQENDTAIDTGTSAIIVPFAQKDDVWAFMEGINPQYQQTIMTLVRIVLGQYPGTVAELLPAGTAPADVRRITRKLDSWGNQLLRAVLQTTSEYRRVNYVNPVMDAVDVLPKDELANMAESLVSLTSFKQRMSMDAETVGGPVDVAVISKGDGFIWIRRKHYFDPKFNPHFTTNYFRDREALLDGTGATDGVSGAGKANGTGVPLNGGVSPAVPAEGRPPHDADG